MRWLRGIAIILIFFGAIMALLSMGTAVFWRSVLVVIFGIILEVFYRINTRERKYGPDEYEKPE